MTDILVNILMTRNFLESAKGERYTEVSNYKSTPGVKVSVPLSRPQDDRAKLLVKLTNGC